MATTTHWLPNSSASSATSSGRSTAAVLTPTLSAPARNSRRASSTRAHAAADGEGDEHLLGRAGHHVDHGPAVVGRGGDVEEDELVGALGVVAAGQLDRVAGVEEVGEPHALDHPAGVDVEAGDHPDGAHAATASSTRQPPVDQRPAGDDAGQAPSAGRGLPIRRCHSLPTGHLERGQRPQVGDRRDATRGDDRERGGSQHGAQAVEVRAAQRAVAVDGGDHDARRARHRPTRRAARPPCARSPAPSPARPPRSARFRPAVVDAERHPAGKAPPPAVGPASGSSTAAVPSTTRAHPADRSIVDIGRPAHPAADLDRDVHRAWRCQPPPTG